jgi:hypothetical protein
VSKRSPEKILEDIKNWTTEKTKLIVEPLDDPKTHFTIRVSPPTPHIIISITIAYPKNDDTIIMGWN